MLIDDGMLELAEDWASSAEEAEDEEQECYVMEDGEKVFFPISEKDFTDSLYVESITMNIENNEISLEIFFCCSPDYFAGHCIIVEVDRDGNITSQSLAG